MRPARSTGGRLIIAGYSVAGYCVAANASSGTPYPTTPHSATPHPATPHPVHTRELGHHWFMTQISHLGRRAMHTRRPWRISVCENQVHWSRGTSPIRSRSIFTGSVSRVRPSRVDRRCTCVSTTIPSFFRNQVPSTTFAVLRPTPRRSLVLVLAGMVVPGTYRLRWHGGSMASGLRQERIERPHEMLRGLDVRGVPRGELDHARGQERRGLASRVEGHGVVDAVQEQGAGSGTVRKGLPQSRAQVVFAQAVPDLLLGPGRDAKRGHLASVAGIVKVPRDR